ncbi:MAG: helix-turn-helix domain-containing protein [Clostridiales bacterium]|nr:helix-turn-helix domain-containing protein [Clostridiales bacterium]
MKQPILGKKILELRTSQGMTQEDLADVSGVSSRTIQRIEQGEAEPRGETLKLISIALDFDFNGATTNERLDKTMLFFIQLSNMFLFLLFPILVLIWNNRASYDLEREAKKAINYQLNLLLLLLVLVTIMTVAGAVPILLMTLGEIFLIIIAGVMALIMAVSWIICIRNMLRINDTKYMKYPTIIHFMKMKQYK